MARQARREANLVPGASLRGLVFDACYDNRIPHTFGMLRHFGMPNRNRVLVSESPHLNTAGLAKALRIDESEVLIRRYPAHGRGNRDFYGIHIMKSRIEDGVRRFSPAAIADGTLHHPATHELRDLPFSTVGWDLLQDRCPCESDGVRQNWVTTNGSGRCHSCGGSLGRIDPVPVLDELRDHLEFIARLVDPDPSTQALAVAMLPEALRGTGRKLLYDMVMNLARAISTDADAAGFHARTAALAQACDAILRWPDGLKDLRRSADCPTYIWEWVGRTYSILHAGALNSRKSAIPGVGPAYSASGTAGRLRSSHIGAMAAARLGGVDESALKQAWDEGKFTQHIWVRGTLRVREFDPAEVVAIAPTLRVEGCRAQAGSCLGLPVYGIEQLIEQELFTPAKPGGGVKQSEAHMEAARALAGRIELAATIVAGSTIPLLEAVRHVSGRPKPWAAIVHALLDGHIPFELGSGAKAAGVLGQLRVAGDAASVITAMRHDMTPKIEVERARTWCGADALECLNGNASASQLLDGIEFTGTKKKRRLPVERVLERAAAGVTTFDLTRRSGIGTTRIAARLEANHVGQIAPGLWERSRAEALTLLPGSW